MKTKNLGLWLWIGLGLVLLVLLFAMLEGPQLGPKEELTRPHRVAGRVAPPGLTRFIEEKKEGFAKSEAKIRISGRITVADGLKKQAKPGSVIYVMARFGVGDTGPTVAAKRIPLAEFPISYTIDNNDLMVSGATLNAKLSISARLDQDGDAGTRQKGDLVGVCKKNPVKPGETGADIVLDTVITEEHIPQAHPGANS